MSSPDNAPTNAVNIKAAERFIFQKRSRDCLDHQPENFRTSGKGGCDAISASEMGQFRRFKAIIVEPGLHPSPDIPLQRTNCAKGQERKNTPSAKIETSRAN